MNIDQPSGTVITATPERRERPWSPLRILLDAQHHINSDEAATAVADRVVEAACSVTGARYAGLVLLGVDGEILDHAQHGLTGREIAGLRELIGPISAGRGSSDERISQLASAGLRCFPIVLRRQRIAELYLPRAAPLLTCDSSASGELMTGFVAMVSMALENANLRGDAERTKDWLAASGEIAHGLLADRGAETLVDVMQRALEVADADYAALLLPREDGLLEVAVAAGIGAEEFRGHVMDPAESGLGLAAVDGRSVLLGDVDTVARKGFENVHRLGPVLQAPLVDAHGVRGAILLCRVDDRPPFAVRDLELATTFADQIALALEMDDARAQGAWLSVLEDRHRIAQDLHDNVMQRLFATGVGLQSLAASGGLATDVSRRLARYIDDLDETIDEIRSRVFGLRDVGGRSQHAAPRFPRVANRRGV